MDWSVSTDSFELINTDIGLKKILDDLERDVGINFHMILIILV